MNWKRSAIAGTVALPVIFATDALRRRTVISMRSWSPGSTGRRNRASSIDARRTSLRSRPVIDWRTSTPATWAMDSTMSTPGMTGYSGKWPAKKGSLAVTFLMPTM